MEKIFGGGKKMKSILGKMRKSQKGFTLIELIVVIAILAILAAILIPSVSGMIGTANKATDRANARTVYMAAQVAANSQIATGSAWKSANNGDAKTATEGLCQNLTGSISQVTIKDADGTVSDVTYVHGSNTITYDGKNYTP